MENLELNPIEISIVRNEIEDQIRTCYDPEIPVNIYELGLIYEINVNSVGEVNIKMTLTSPSCPAAQILPNEVKIKSEKVPRVKSVSVEIVWEPRWDMSMMTEEARLTLGF